MKHAGQVLAKGISQGVLDGDDLVVQAVLLAAAGCLADMDPVGGLAAGSPVALGLHDGFEHYGVVALALMPVAGKLTRDAGQDLGDHALGLDPGKDQIAGVVDDELQNLQRLVLLPAEVAVASGEPPDSGTKAQQVSSAFIFSSWNQVLRFGLETAT